MTPKVADGRTVRREKSRQRIIDVLIQVILEGKVEPTAEQVGKLAGVTRRTVFRHFDDMESLYREIIHTVHIQVDTLHVEYDPDRNWREELERLILRRTSRFEKFMPLAIATQALRHSSPAIEEDAQQWSRQLRRVLKMIVPDDLVGDVIAFSAIDAMLSWDMWIRLRRDQKLSIKRATQVIQNAVNAVLENTGI
jgi:AcrR family transcriptional regulator